MRQDLLRQLKSWRDEQARIEGVEAYRVMNNATLEALIGRMPTTHLELLEVKGIKAAKSRKYGKTLLALMAEHRNGVSSGEMATAPRETINGEAPRNEPLSVSQFLDSSNIELSGLAARVQGEVSSLDIRERVVYFSLKDKEDESIVNCVMFRNAYTISGVELTLGDEVIVEGAPEIYKPSGRFSLKVGVIELFGEGALKKAYDALYKKLESEGLFAPERKRTLPEFIERVALITSPDGAAIGDFTMNLGRNGMHIDFFPTAVEGKRAVFEILKAVEFFNHHPERYDCLVIIRGGGSLESLQAFNTEALARAVATSNIPVLAGVGHEKDVTLSALTADRMVSTPTATARLLGTPWEEARITLRHATTILIQNYVSVLGEGERMLKESTESLGQALRDILTSVRNLEQHFSEKLQVFPYLLSTLREELVEIPRNLTKAFQASLQNYRERLVQMEQAFRQYDPERLLSLGYSLVRTNGDIVRSASTLHSGDRLDIQFKDGAVESKVIKKL